MVDDERQVRELLANILRSESCEVLTADGGAEACRLLADSPFDLVFSDLRMPGGDGIEVLGFIRRMNLKTLGVIVTGHGSLDTAVKALRAGAFDFVTKPFHMDDIKEILRKADRFEPQPAPQTGILDLLAPLSGKKGGRKLVGRSSAMRTLNELIAAVAGSSSTVLIRGESGTGKELVAHALHHNSPRRKKPFVPVNCGAIPEDLLESELFGHVRGSFTGAISDRPGRFVLADGGTIFLDEIGDMSPKLQVKVLRVLQEHELEPVGSAETIQVDVRVLAATNVDLELAVAEKRFREDLYYRLNVIPIEVPPLRDHPEDLPALIRHFIRIFNKRQPRQIEGFDLDAIALLKKFFWPGNVRELENLVERMTILAKGAVVTLEDLPHKFRTPVLFVPQPVSLFPQTEFPPAPRIPAASAPGHVPQQADRPHPSFDPAPQAPFFHGQPPARPQLADSSGEGVSVAERDLILSPHSILPPSAEPAASLAASPPARDRLHAAVPADPLPAIPDEGMSLNKIVDKYERALILGALDKCGGVKSRAAKFLGIKRTTLVEKMKKKNIVFSRK